MSFDFSPAALRRPVWIRFDTEDRLMPAPGFCLPDPAGEAVCLADFRGDCNLVVYFPSTADCAPCETVIAGLAARAESYRQHNARLIVVAPAPPAAQRTPRPEAGLVTLSDPGGETRQAYAGLMAEGLVRPEDDLLFVLDEYGAPYAALLGASQGIDQAEALHEAALAWLEFISVQCPE